MDASVSKIMWQQHEANLSFVHGKIEPRVQTQRSSANYVLFGLGGSIYHTPLEKNHMKKKNKIRSHKPNPP